MRHRATDGLTWYPELGYGYYPVVGGNAVYDLAYFQRYQAYTATPMGRALTAARVALVDRWCAEADVLDIGIGAGDFLEARRPHAPTFGYDVNPVAVAWLVERGLFRDPCHGPMAGMTFWDSLEHLADPQIVLSQVALSFGIPFALIPLLLFCRDRSLMGSLVNRRATTVAAAVITVVIIGLNAFLLEQTLL